MITQNNPKGITLIEVMIASALLAIAIIGTMSLLATTNSYQESNKEFSLVVNAARQVVESMKDSGDFVEIYSRYDNNPANDPVLPPIPGPDFDIYNGEVYFAAEDTTGLRKDLDPVPGQNFVGTVSFPAVGTQLREDVVDDELRMPMDLNADGAIDSADHATDYTVLPVVVQLGWRGFNGDESFTLRTVMFPR